MILYPNEYFKNVTQIREDYLKEHNIKALILDVDNTLIDYDRNLPNEIANWVEKMKKANISMLILSNTNQKDKVEELGNKLGIEYIYFAMKPLKIGFKKVKKILNLESKNIAVVGDQIFTDVIGANRMKMYSILVEPLKEKDILITKIKRPVEELIKRSYLKTKEEN